MFKIASACGSSGFVITNVYFYFLILSACYNHSRLPSEHERYEHTPKIYAAHLPRNINAVAS